MPLSPEDVVRKTFPQARFGGYVASEVDAFLEEVVGELQRLNGRIDELQAAQATRGSALSDDERRARIEVGQLEQVRKERADLVDQIVVLQEQYDALRSDISQGVAQRSLGS